MMSLLVAAAQALVAWVAVGGLLGGCVDSALHGGADGATVQPEAAAPIETVDDLLRALETAGGEIARLSADVRYDKTFDIQGDTQSREGKLVFESAPGSEGAANRRFGVTFRRLVVGTRVEDEKTGYLEQYIFDGEWLAEVYPREKQFIRRQVVAPGERWDPLRIGEGPFPIPIQQKRDDILRDYTAELVESTETLETRGLQVVGEKCFQLRLTPRPEAGDMELREVRVWYERDTLLPRIARTVTKADDVSLVLLKNVRLNGEAEVSESELSTAPPDDRAGWDISVQPWGG